MAGKKRERPKAIIVLAVHGSPPLDFPRAEMVEFMSLEAGAGPSGSSLPKKSSTPGRLRLRTSPASWPLKSPASSEPHHFLAFSGSIRRRSNPSSKAPLR